MPSGLVIRTLLKVGFKSVFTMFALLFLAFVLMGFLGMPHAIIEWITAKDLLKEDTPDWIVVLGGAGIPSESGLMRTYYGAEWAKQFPDAEIIVSLPTDEDPEDSHVGRMKRELILRGVDPDRIFMEFNALNTHYQAVAVSDMLGDAAATSRVAVVTSPSHLRRSLACFQAQGMPNSFGVAALNQAEDAYMGKVVELRYVFWARLHFQLKVLRESVGYLYYKMRGWV